MFIIYLLLLCTMHSVLCI